MAEFSSAFAKTAAAEGGYAFIDGDTGLETYAGISRRSFPKWEGWHTVDAHEMQQGDILPDLASTVKQFYCRNFWNPLMLDAVEDQGIADKMYDMAVNAGISAAVKLAQKTVGVKQTGTMSTELIDKLNNPTV